MSKWAAERIAIVGDDSEPIHHEFGQFFTRGDAWQALRHHAERERDSLRARGLAESRIARMLHIVSALADEPTDRDDVHDSGLIFRVRRVD